MEESHAAHDEKFTALKAHVERAYWPVCRETDRSGAKQSATGLTDIQSGPVRIDEFETAELVAVVQIIFGVMVFARVFAGLLIVLFFFAAAGSIVVNTICYLLYPGPRKATISDKRFFGMQVLVERFADNGVRIH